MNLRAEAPSSATRTGRPAVAVPDVSAHVIQFVSAKRTHHQIVAAHCLWCSENHRHTTTGFRVAPCNGRVYNLVAVGGA